MSEHTSRDQREGTGPVQRRTIIKGAAWSVPVIAAAVAAPAYAASASCKGSQLFAYQGSAQTFDLSRVCPDATMVEFIVVGGQGASPLAREGLGTAITGVIPLAADKIFTLAVGQGGSDAGGWGFGSGGDGADVSVIGGPPGGGGGGGSALALGNQLVAVAGGGGGIGTCTTVVDPASGLPDPTADTAPRLSTKVLTTQFWPERAQVKWGAGNGGESNWSMNGYTAYQPDGTGCAGRTPTQPGPESVFLVAPGGAAAVNGTPGATDSGIVITDSRYSSTWTKGNAGGAQNGPAFSALGTTYRGGNGGDAVVAPYSNSKIISGGGGGGYAGGAGGGAGLVTQSPSPWQSQQPLQYTSQGGAGSNYVGAMVAPGYTVANGTYTAAGVGQGGNGWIQLRWY